jgi:hypothetical protein
MIGIRFHQPHRNRWDLYPHARRVGNLLFLSGVGPRERGSSEIPGVVLGRKRKRGVDHDIERQCRSVFATCAPYSRKPGRTGANSWM